MGRRSSDSEEDSRSRRRRKQRRRSSSSSSSSSSSRNRVSTSRSQRSSRKSRSRDRDRERDRDRDRDRRRKRRSSSSSSHSSSRRRRSRSADRDKGRSHRSHRSRSRDRRSHSRHRRSYSRRRSRSRSRDRSRRTDKDRDKERDKDRDKNRDKDRSKDKLDKRGDPGSIKPKGLEHLTPSEQAKARMQLVLQAAAKTDEVLKAKVAKREEDARKKVLEEGTSLEEQVRRIKDIEAIESDSFVPQAFKSSRDQLRGEVKQEVEKVDSVDVSLPLSTVYNDTDTLAHPNLFMDKGKAEELWMKRLISLRQERLLGSPVT